SKEGDDHFVLAGEQVVHALQRQLRGIPKLGHAHGLNATRVEHLLSCVEQLRACGFLGGRYSHGGPSVTARTIVSRLPAARPGHGLRARTYRRCVLSPRPVSGPRWYHSMSRRPARSTTAATSAGSCSTKSRSTSCSNHSVRVRTSAPACSASTSHPPVRI